MNTTTTKGKARAMGTHDSNTTGSVIVPHKPITNDSVGSSVNGFSADRPVTTVAPAKGVQPVATSTAVRGSQPVVTSTPVKDDQPVVTSTTADDDRPVTTSAPARDDVSVTPLTSSGDNQANQTSTPHGDDHASPLNTSTTGDQAKPSSASSGGNLTDPSSASLTGDQTSSLSASSTSNSAAPSSTPPTSTNASTNLDENTIVNRLSAVGIAGNVFLSAFKLAAGILGNSSAMVSDAVHSFSDVVATFIALVGAKISMRDADTDHPYGHERIECLAALVLGIILVVTGLGIGAAALERVLAGNYDTLPIPGVIALIAAIVSIVAKEAMFRYTRHYARLIGSAAFEADAWHHRSDALSSIGALIGIAGSMLGFPLLDPIASLVICLFILKAAADIMIDAVRKLLDTACDADFEASVRDVVSAQPGVGRIDLLHTRMFGSKVYVDLEISVDGTMPLSAAHAIAEEVHDQIEADFPTVKHVMVHVNPL